MSDDLPPPKNGVIDGANKFLSIVMDAAGIAAKAGLVALSPVFGWPVISQIVDFFIAKVKDALYKELSNSTTFLIIDVQEVKKLHAYMDELVELKKAQESEDPNDDPIELEKTREALADLIRMHS